MVQGPRRRRWGHSNPLHTHSLLGMTSQTTAHWWLSFQVGLPGDTSILVGVTPAGIPLPSRACLSFKRRLGVGSADPFWDTMRQARL